MKFERNVICYHCVLKFSFLRYTRLHGWLRWSIRYNERILLCACAFSLQNVDRKWVFRASCCFLEKNCNLKSRVPDVFWHGEERREDWGEGSAKRRQISNISKISEFKVALWCHRIVCGFYSQRSRRCSVNSSEKVKKESTLLNLNPVLVVLFLSLLHTCSYRVSVT